MKKSLIALALFAFAGSPAFAQDGPGKGATKAVASTSPKSGCAMSAKSSMAGSACCVKKETKVASAKPAAKAPVTAKL